MALPLLPSADQRLACTDHRRTIGVDPGGTAIRADLVVGVEIPLPWPKPVFAHPLLAGLDRLAAGRPRPVRVLAVVPSASDGSLSVIAWSRHGAVVERRRWIGDARTVSAIARAVLTGEHDVPGEACADRTWSAEVWICTQGSHDACCGSEGMRLAIAAELEPDLEVRRVSHTGGHRFAPTAMTFPDGRMWADVDLDLLRAVWTRRGMPLALAPRCRGWWGADPGPVQVAERAAFAASGWGWEDLDRSASIVASTGTRTTVVVRGTRPGSTTHLEEYSVTVEVAREVPTISCRVPGGLPVKPGVEHRVVEIVPLDAPSSGRAG